MTSQKDISWFLLTQFGEKNRHGKTGSSLFTVRVLQKMAAQLFREIGIETDVLDAQILLAHILKKTYIEVQLEGNLKLTPVQFRRFFSLLKRRLCFEPIAYLIGMKEFFGREFLVSKNCLIPRPDTETVVEKCLSLIDKEKYFLIFDVCTGSGAIGISILCECPMVDMYASDISKSALNIAGKNAHILGVKDRLTLLHGDLFTPFQGKPKANLIVANPPYIGLKSFFSLATTVRAFEPAIALNSGDDFGLSFYKRFLSEAPKYLCSKGFLLMEIGFDQALAIEKLIGPEWASFEFFRDLAGHQRGIVLQTK
jgi:release factor glutamine methyltransferase